MQATTALAAAMMRACSDVTAAGHDLAGRRGAATRGPGRSAGAHPGQPRRLLRALGEDLGVPGAAEGATGRRRPRPRRRLRRRGVAAGLGRRPGGRASSPTSRRCGAGWSTRWPPGDVEREVKLGPGGLRDVEFAVQLLQLVHGRADTVAAQPVDDGRARRRSPPAATSAARTQRGSPPRTGSCVPSSTGCSSSTCGVRTCCRPPRPASAGWRGRWASATSRSGGGSTTAMSARCAGCTRSCSTGRCSTRSRGCRCRTRA